MDERCSKRYKSSRLPDELARVNLVLKDCKSVESTVVDICSHGMGVEISPASGRSAAIQKNETFKVCFSPEHAGFSGQCVHTDTGADGGTRLGIHFYYPNEQNSLYQILRRIPALVEPKQETDSRGMELFVNRRVVRHGWEELMQMLCRSENPDVRSISLQEIEVLRQGQIPKNCAG
jgi:hypothetical protein